MTQDLFVLLVQEPGSPPRTLQLRGLPFTIGGATTDNVRLRAAPPARLVVVRREDGYALTCHDLTRCSEQDEPVAEAALAHGDRFNAGQARIRFFVGTVASLREAAQARKAVATPCRAEPAPRPELVGAPAAGGNASRTLHATSSGAPATPRLAPNLERLNELEQRLQALIPTLASSARAEIDARLTLRAESLRRIIAR